MRRPLACMTAVVLACAFCFMLRAGLAAEIDAKVLSYPGSISRLSDFYVRVQVKNVGKAPLRGCDISEERCIAVAWDYIEDNSVLSLPRKNIVPLLTYAGNYLSPGQTVEKSIRIPVGSLSRKEAILGLYFIVREGPQFNLQQYRLKMAVKAAPKSVRKRRAAVRTIVYGYLALSVAMLFFFFLAKKRRD